MKILILTTNTPHHNYFIRKIQDLCDQLFVVYETTSIIPVYPTYHPFEDLRETFEKKLWGAKSFALDLATTPNVTCVENINDITDLDYLYNGIDVCIVFGTRRIKTATIEILPSITVNLHGGDPQLYRGLDSHLWALWHRDILGLKTCLHHLHPQLDTGDIIAMKKLDISSLNDLSELRALNTKACIELSRNFLDSLHIKDPIEATRQEQVGRYYSFMPADLKDVVAKTFASNLRGLHNAI